MGASFLVSMMPAADSIQGKDLCHIRFCSVFYSACGDTVHLFSILVQFALGIYM